MITQKLIRLALIMPFFTFLALEAAPKTAAQIAAEAAASSLHAYAGYDFLNDDDDEGDLYAHNSPMPSDGGAAAATNTSATTPEKIDLIELKNAKFAVEFTHQKIGEYFEDADGILEDIQTNHDEDAADELLELYEECVLEIVQLVVEATQNQQKYSEVLATFTAVTDDIPEDFISFILEAGESLEAAQENLSTYQEQLYVLQGPQGYEYNFPDQFCADDAASTAPHKRAKTETSDDDSF